jgi:hypothetical protein
MRIIFSRKGFDSKHGQVPSPIFEDSRMFSLPIPSPQDKDKIRFRDVKIDGIELGGLVANLTKQRIRSKNRCHLDPDLRNKALGGRPTGCRPAFGQCEAAETHLRNEGVDCEDLFLFYGSFRRVKKRGNGFVYEPGSPTQHVTFGWLRIGYVHRLPANWAKLPTCLKSHPHAEVHSKNTM